MDATVTIAKNQSVVTLINVFSVDRDKQAELVRVLVQATEEVMRHVPGFVSASIHRSLDGTQVTNYAQWTTRDAFEAMLKDPKAQHHMKAAADLARFEPHLYEVASVHAR